jgi:hypothetical protein
MKTRSEANREDWSGLEFANGWQIQKKLNCAEYRQIYIEQTGDTTKQIKNTHYLCYNKNCGVSTYIERTVIQRAINNQTPCLSKCKGCTGSSENCHYSIQCREKHLTKTPDRAQKIQVGNTYGAWIVNSILSSGMSSDHQMRAVCMCKYCGKQDTIRCDCLFERTAACECFKRHSIGEMAVKEILDTLKITYNTEQRFEGLVGLKGSPLRYDFALMKDTDIVALVEYDGEQHFSKPGTRFNEDGSVQIHDAMKNEYAKNNNIPLLRIPYFDLMRANEIMSQFLDTIDLVK